MFLRPDELDDRLARRGLTMRETVGLAPRAAPWTVARGLLQLRRGRISYRRASELLDFDRVGCTSLGYMGFAEKAKAAELGAPGV